MSFPEAGLASARVALCPAHEAHASELQRHYLANRVHLQAWEPSRPERFFELDAIAERLRSMALQTSAGNALHLLMYEREGGKLIGDCNFTHIVRGPFQACHLGFSVATAFEGKGLMRESLTVAIDYVFTSLRLHRIMANYRPENTRSENLLARLGFEKEGFARSYLKINGSWADHVLSSKVNPYDAG